MVDPATPYGSSAPDTHLQGPTLAFERQVVRGRTHLPVTVDVAFTPAGCEVSVDGPFGVVTGRGVDAFAALTEVRRQIEPQRWLLAVQGARGDTYPDETSTRTGGLTVFLLSGIGPETSTGPLHTFDPAPFDALATVEDQQAAARPVMDAVSSSAPQPPPEPPPSVEPPPRSPDPAVSVEPDPAGAYDLGPSGADVDTGPYTAAADTGPYAAADPLGGPAPDPDPLGDPAPEAEAPHAAPPPITDAMRKEARAQPGSWLYTLDPAFSPDAQVPPEGIVGAYRVDDGGQIIPEWTPNPSYRPTPTALRWPAPTDAVDHAAQMAKTGWGGYDAVESALEAADLRVAGDSAEQIDRHELDGVGECAFLFTHPAHAEAGWTAEGGHAPVTMETLRRVLGQDPSAQQLTVAVNPFSPGRLTLPVSRLLGTG